MATSKTASIEAEPVETPTELPASETLSDQEILERIQAEMERNRSRGPRRVTIAENFQQGVALIAAATGKNFRGAPKVTEQTAVRIYELTLMWALNNRDQAGSPSILDEDEIDTEPIGSDLPTPNEIIEAADDAASEE